MLERFEKYREKVKKEPYEQCKRHPRSSVVGDEFVAFYSTVMICSERSAQISGFHGDPFCRICRTIQSSLFTEHRRKNGIRLSTRSDELCDSMAALTKEKNAKRAVIVCRKIAGRIAKRMVDGSCEECDSFTNGLHLNIGDLIETPASVLPALL